MNLRDDDLRAVLLSRAQRSPALDLGRMFDVATEAPRDGRWAGSVRIATFLRDSTATVVVAAVLVATLGLGAWLRFGGGAAPLPVGLFQSDVPVGTGDVGAETCVALDLTDEAYQSGSVEVWWWEMGDGGCQTSTSGPMAETATITTIQLPAAGALPERAGFVIELELQLLPSGTETVAFTLDPLRLQADSSLAGYSDRDPLGRALSFRPVQSLDVELPGGAPAPTPGQ